jgi:hypothetical protein
MNVDLIELKIVEKKSELIKKVPAFIVSFV